MHTLSLEHEPLRADSEPPTIDLIFEEVDLTAALAEKYLGRNVNNRNIRKRDVNMYAKTMADGQWAPRTGETIKFDLDHNMTDGQHRCLAAIKAANGDPGFSVRVTVVYNVPSSAQRVIDSGIRRTIGDSLKLDGIRNADTVGAAVRLVLRYQAGVLVSNKRAISTTEIRDFLERTPTFEDFIGQRIWKVRDLPGHPSCLLAGFWLIREKQPERFNDFFDGLTSLTNMANGDPRLAFYRRLVDAQKGRGAGLTTADQIGLLLLCWNHYLAGHSLSKMQLPKGGWETGTFPVPK